MFSFILEDSELGSMAISCDSNSNGDRSRSVTSMSCINSVTLLHCFSMRGFVQDCFQHLHLIQTHLPTFWISQVSTIQHSHLEDTDADAAHTRMRFSAAGHLAKQEALLRRVLMAEVQTLEMICREHLATVLLKSRLKQVNLFGEILQQSIEAWAKEVQRLDLSYDSFWI